jgi:hypothetical protein
MNKLYYFPRLLPVFVALTFLAGAGLLDLAAESVADLVFGAAFFAAGFFFGSSATVSFFSSG